MRLASGGIFNVGLLLNAPVQEFSRAGKSLGVWQRFLVCGLEF